MAEETDSTASVKARQQTGTRCVVIAKFLTVMFSWVKNARLMTVVFRSAKERNFRGAKDDSATGIFRTMLTCHCYTARTLRSNARGSHCR